MREILFMAKRLDNGDMIRCGSIVRFFDDGVLSVFVLDGSKECECLHDEYTDNIESCPKFSLVKVAPETVCQYTGLTDKNGIEIFEGDKVRVCLNPEIKTGVVRYNAEIACFCIDFDDGFSTFLDFEIAKRKVKDKVWIEVIGNIHDTEVNNDA